MTRIKFGVIWPCRLQDYNVLVWTKDAKIFLQTHLEVKFVSKPLQMNFKVIQNQHTNTLAKKYHLIGSLCLQNGFQMSKNNKKSCKTPHLKLNLLLLKCLSVTHNFLDWYEILATQTRLVCTTLPIFYIRNEHYMKKKQAAKVWCNPKMLEFRI